MDARINISPEDAERYPTLTPHGMRILQLMTDHPNAPIFRNQSGNRLLPEDLERVRAFEAETLASDVDWIPAQKPDWLAAFAERCHNDVPFYRNRHTEGLRFEDLSCIDRSDLSRDIAAFVPDSVDIDRLINFRTSGTTGHPLLLASHPIVAASYLAFHKKALRRAGIQLQHGRGQVGVVLLGYQRKCFTYVSVTPSMDESGLAKINLHPDDWRDPEDRAKYLDALATEVYAGDPISLAEFVKLPLHTKPRAILSTSMALSAGLKAQLEQTFGCPVLDFYSLNEAGPVAVFEEGAGGHVLLQHTMYVEIVDATGRALPAGERGEVTLTGGFNFCLPLLRYRTGDFAELQLRGRNLVLVGLEGRPPVRFRTQLGEMINNIEISHALQGLAIPQYTLHQDAQGALQMTLVQSMHHEKEIRSILIQLFGPAQSIQINETSAVEGKVVQYTSALRESQV